MAILPKEAILSDNILDGSCSFADAEAEINRQLRGCSSSEMSVYLRGLLSEEKEEMILQLYKNAGWEGIRFHREGFGYMRPACTIIHFVNPLILPRRFGSNVTCTLLPERPYLGGGIG